MNRNLAVWMRRLRSLSRQDVWLLLRITGILLILPPLLRWFSLPRVMKLLDPGLGAASGRGSSPSRMIQLTQRLLDQNIGVFRDTCLKRSLVLFRLLRRAGHPAVIRFGVAKDGEDVTGHSWLEQSGELIAEKSDPYESFAVIYSYPSTAARK
ncbi:MAG: lasso peptide biosynthesis B2 protein [bacterium]|nr:lasso peptide biosynthesis B2 protein [bacterium]